MTSGPDRINLQFSDSFSERKKVIAGLVRNSFSASEGEEEGNLVGRLTDELMKTTTPSDIHVFCADMDNELVGVIIFTKLEYEEDPRSVFLLSPVAVATRYQGKGVGTQLIRHGLKTLQNLGVEIAITYGDPEYYGRFGFEPLDIAIAQPPFPLSQPHGWIGQSLTVDPLAPLKGPSRCAKALSSPEYW